MNLKKNNHRKILIFSFSKNIFRFEKKSFWKKNENFRKMKICKFRAKIYNRVSFGNFDFSRKFRFFLKNIFFKSKNIFWKWKNQYFSVIFFKVHLHNFSYPTHPVRAPNFTNHWNGQGFSVRNPDFRGFWDLSRFLQSSLHMSS